MTCLDNDYEKIIKERFNREEQICDPDEFAAVKSGYLAFIKYSKSSSVCGKYHALTNQDKQFLYKFW
jgi:hypothetical protein